MALFEPGDGYRIMDDNEIIHAATDSYAVSLSEPWYSASLHHGMTVGALKKSLKHCPLLAVRRRIDDTDPSPVMQAKSDAVREAKGVIAGSAEAPDTGAKYRRKIHPRKPGDGDPIVVDVYCVGKAFAVPTGPRHHALKKILCAGLRGKGDEEQDLAEAIDALRRDLQQLREGE